MKSRVFLFLMMLLLSVFAVQAAADTHLKVGVYQNKPKVFVDKDGQAKGFFVDVLETIADMEGWTVEYIPGNWDQCLERLGGGEIDLMVDIAYSQERAEIYDFQNLTVVNNWAQLYVRDEDISSVLDLEGKKLGVLTGDISYIRFKEQLEHFGVKVEFVEVKSFIDIFQLLEDDRVDAGLISRLFGLEYEGDFSAVRSPVMCCPMELRFAAPKGKHREVLDAIDQHLAEMTVDKGSEYYLAQARWLGEEFHMAKPIPRWIWWVVGSALVLALIVFLHHFALHARVHYMTGELRKQNERLEKEVGDRKKAEEDLRKYHKHLEEMVEERTRDLSESRAKYKLLADNISDTIWTMGLDTRFTYASPSAERLTGYRQEEITGMTLADILTPSSLKQATESMQARLKDLNAPDTVNLELEVVHKDRGAFWTEVTSTLMRDEEGEIMGLVGVVRDISERRAAAEALMVSEEKFRNIVESSPMGMHMYELEEDDRLMFVDANPAADRILGVDNAQFVGMTIEEAFPGITLTEVPERYREVAATGKPWRTEEVSYQDQQISGAFEVYGFQTAPGKMTAAFLDVTDRRRAEQALRESEEKFRTIASSAYDAIIMMDHKGKVSFWNAAAEKIFGYTSHEVFGQSVHDLLAPEEFNERYRNAFPKFLETGEGAAIGKALELTALRKDGSEFPIEITVSAVKIAKHWNAIAIIRDITERKKAEEEIRQREEQYRGIFDTVTDALLIIDTDGKIVEASPSAFEMYGYPPDEFIGMTGKDFVDPSYYHKFEDFKTQVKETGRFRADSKDIRKDGTSIYVDVKGTMFNYKGKPHLLAVNSDITERKRAEKTIRETNRELQQALKDLKATQTHLVQSEKMASLGRLVAGVAHEFNNPIGAVRSSNSNLKTSIGKLESLCVPIVEDTVPKKKMLDKLMKVIRDANQVIEEGTDRVATIVQRMKAFARLDEAEWQLSDLHQCIEDSLQSLPRGWDERITLKREFGILPKVACYPAQVNQVLHNVLNNAVEAIKGKGKILVATAVEDDRVVIRVKDNGRGISEKDLEKIFDPGYTTKSRGVGTGLGLAISYQIMQEHKGTIEVDSEPGKGTEVRLRFPVRI